MANFPHQPSPYDPRHRPLAEILQQLMPSPNASAQRLTAANAQLRQQNQVLNAQALQNSDAYSNLRHIHQGIVAENTELKSILGNIAEALGVGNLISDMPIAQQGTTITEAVRGIQADINALNNAARDAAHIPAWTSNPLAAEENDHQEAASEAGMHMHANPLAEGDEDDYDELGHLINQYGFASPVRPLLQTFSPVPLLGSPAASLGSGLPLYPSISSALFSLPSQLASPVHHDDLRDQGQHPQRNHGNNDAWVSGSAQLGASYALFAERGAAPSSVAQRSGNGALLRLSSSGGWQPQQR